MPQPLTQMSVKGFLDDLSGSSPAPGGGSVAALSGALGAALVSMVCNLTLGKERYADVQDEISQLLARSKELCEQLTHLLEADVQAYNQVSQAMKMPRNTEEQKVARVAALEASLKKATQVPLQVAEACVSVMDLCRPAAEKGNPNAVSDAGVAVLMAEAGLRSAALNVLINLGWIRDEAFVRENRARLEGLLAGKPALRDEIYQLVVDKL